MADANPYTLGVDHVGLTVSDIERSRRFFVECLGWKVVGENPAYPAVFVSDGMTRVTLWQADGDHVAFDRRRNVGLHHLALKIGNLDVLLELHARVSAWPDVVVEFAPEPVGKGPRVHCMVREPGGVRIELVCTPSG
ncbi:VOC family protein [Rhodanobacter ginsengiterrae]|uniref:VOC family protein n=1 Tax=Rhodanobacter ginsengiterrae TaxID=2008451 RepID=UPI003CF463DC